MSNQKSELDKDLVTRLAIAIGLLCGILGKWLIKGLFRKDTWRNETMKIWLMYFAFVIAITYAHHYDLVFFLDPLPSSLSHRFGNWIVAHLNRASQLALFSVVPFILWITAIGAYSSLRLIRYQRSIDHLGMKTFTNMRPTVVDLKETGQHRRKLVIKAIGIDVAEFKNRKGALESAFGAIVEDIYSSETNRQLIEILIAEKSLATLIHYEDAAVKHLQKPYTFLVGQSLSEFMIGDLTEIHHMIVAGSTGGGKSFFFKQALVGLAESSKRIQFYLIDLKRGVEVKLFENLENVRIAKETPDAIAMLTAVVAEMEKRFKYLEERGFTEINPERDKKDRIVVGIDEASVLFTIEKSSRSTKASAESARDLTDRIAKLGRAAAIHLILATQKVVKETIDTRVQTNINARMVFRVNTVASSMTVLGNKMAAELPEVKGRGIWSVGSKDIILQVPRLTQDQATERIDALTDKFNGNAKSHFGPMLVTMQEPQSTKSAFASTKKRIEYTAKNESKAA